jgi:hypothetical protein
MLLDSGQVSGVDSMVFNGRVDRALGRDGVGLLSLTVPGMGARLLAGIER